MSSVQLYYLPLHIFLSKWYVHTVGIFPCSCVLLLLLAEKFHSASSWLSCTWLDVLSSCALMLLILVGPAVPVPAHERTARRETSLLLLSFVMLSVQGCNPRRAARKLGSWFRSVWRDAKVLESKKDAVRLFLMLTLYAASSYCGCFTSRFFFCNVWIVC